MTERERMREIFTTPMQSWLSTGFKAGGGKNQTQKEKKGESL